jgi:hypothetical protein
MTRIVAFSALILAGSALAWAVFRHSVTQAEESLEIILFRGENFTGNQIRLTNSVLDMPQGALDGPEELRGWNDTIGSVIVVRGTWRLYQHGRHNTGIDTDESPEQVVLAEKVPEKGWTCLVSAAPDGPREYASPAIGGWDSDVSSVELVSTQSLPAWAVLQR